MPIQSADVTIEYIKNKDLLHADVEMLKEWAEKQPNLPKMSELQLILFLQSCYCKIEPTKKTIEAFFSLKSHSPDFFANRNPYSPRTKESMECGVYGKLSKQTAEGYDVLVFSFMDGDPHSFNYVDQVKIFDMFIRLWLEENGTSQGLVILLDIEKFTLSHLGKLSISAVRDYINYLQDALPVRLKGLHFVNAGSVIDRIMLMIKPFLKKELSEMVYIHKEISESLFKFVPQECLPWDFGGKAESLQALHGAMKKKILDNVDWLLQDEKQMADSATRVSRRRSSITGDKEIDGSFKHLMLD